MQAIASAGLSIGVDPLGGAAIDFWEPIAERYGLNINVVNKNSTRHTPYACGQGRQDPHGLFLSLRMAGLIELNTSMIFHSPMTGHRQARHRHQEPGTDEPEPLSGRCH